MILDQIPSRDYHAHPALSAGGVVDMVRSPGHYRAGRDNPSAPSRAMVDGTAIHAGTLEPIAFAAAYVRSEHAKLTEAGAKAEKARVEADGRIRLAQKTYDACLAVALAAQRHSYLGAYLRAPDAQCEGTLFWDAYGVPAKCRPDLLVPSLGLVVDLKTCTDCRPEAFARTIATLDYHVRAAWYLDGLTRKFGPLRWIWAAIEREPPYAIRLYEAHPDDLHAGWLSCEQALLTYERCVEAGTWPAYDQPPETIRRPSWAAKGDPSDE